jgi:hypothetical protein
MRNRAPVIVSAGVSGVGESDVASLRPAFSKAGRINTAPQDGASMDFAMFSLFSRWDLMFLMLLAVVGWYFIYVKHGVDLAAALWHHIRPAYDDDLHE